MLLMASAGLGTSNHLGIELLQTVTGTKFLHIPYKGTNDFIPDLLSGRVPISFSSPLVMQAHVKAEINKWGPIIKKAGVYAD